ncbi:RrF2 family transcriptional regulator [Chitinimonas koreensis]|uniref:RrF2 family transcriptional regulator n=1 Tax=Chitinimonas koreensis TaxID=356302 RepID=UPI0004186773|nr:Rrf2 family transcriptional regulator [Chitinimonas koreensis]QNM95122.1 Rrf2 family transcriptional regulator [Chitinimonas koreensis]
MRLTQFSDHTLRLLIYLALHGDRLVTIQTVAEAYDVSVHHLTKVAHQLVRRGLVQALRGKGGGIRLARPAAEIALGDVLRSAEGGAAPVGCATSDRRCRLSADCRLAGVLHDAFETFYAVLDRTTLADLVERPGPLQRQLGIVPPSGGCRPAREAV